MANKIYLVKKDPVNKNEAAEWIQMTGTEFYAFCRSEEGKGRYFIRLTDDIDYEAEEIFIEVDRQEYLRWKREYNAHRYREAGKKNYELLYLDAPTPGGEFSLIDTLESGEPQVEERILEAEERGQLYAAMEQLSEEEKKLIRVLYFSGRVLTEKEAGERLGMSQQC